jgi:tetratricopeptide (TPR) repeat protein
MSRSARTLTIIAACLMAALVTGGCAGVAPAQNPTERQAVSLNQRAARAYEQGDFRRAAALYEQALRLNASIENTGGIAANALSLARAHQAAGNAAAAHGALDQVLGDSPLPFTPAQRAEAQARKAQLYLDAGDAARAREWSDHALASCAGCAALPAILNLRARAALAAGDPSGALEWSAKALAATVDGRTRERANALRLTGEARLARGEHQTALAPLEQALELDRELGLQARIHSDLMALGSAQLQLGDRAKAREYFNRAHAVSEAANDPAGVRAADRAVDALQPAPR